MKNTPVEEYSITFKYSKKNFHKKIIILKQHRNA